MDNHHHDAVHDAVHDWQHGTGNELTPDEPLPPYSLLPEPGLIHNQTDDDPSARMPKPCVVPRESNSSDPKDMEANEKEETAQTYHGSIYRPFARAYPPDLLPHGITRSDFIAFVDGLNEVWLADPYLQAISVSGNVLNFMPLLETQIVGLGVTIAAEYGSIKLSQMRTEAYLRLANTELFKPKGLRVQILKTWEMMHTAGIPRTVLQLRPAGEDERFEDLDDTNTDKGKGREYDPQLRRMEALKDYVMPLTFDPGRPSFDNWLKQASEKQERFFSERQNSIIRGKREKAAKQVSEAESVERELNRQADELESAKAKATIRAAERLSGPLGESNQGQLWIQEDLEKELKKLDKQVQRVSREKEKKVTRKVQQSERRLHRVEKREHRIVQKVMWIVVSADDGTGFENHLMEHTTYME